MSALFPWAFGNAPTVFGSLFPGTVPFGNNYRIPDRCEQFVIKNSTFCKKRRAIFHISKAVAVILPVRGVNLPSNTL